MRQMYFTRIGAETDGTPSDYQSIGMADTGTRRHEAIQEVLLKMEQLGYDWRYLDVAEYVKRKQALGKCLTLEVLGSAGAETHLRDTALHMSFRCDGIIEQISTGNRYLFEFKNQTSFKFRGKECVDDAHVDQVVCYCTLLDLSKALVLYENRDVTELACPEVFLVTEEMKQRLCVNKILECEGYVERLIPPPKHKDTSPCKWCNYKNACAKAGGR